MSPDSGSSTSSYTEPEWSDSALVTIDVQRDFSLAGAPAEIPGTTEAVPKIVELLEAYRASGSPIIHVVRLYRSDGTNVDLCRRKKIENGEQIVCPGTNGAQLVQELLPTPDVELDCDHLIEGGIQELGPNEVAIYKPRWGAFYETPLQSYLTRREVNTLVVCGCNFPNCPRATIYEASERDFRIVVVEDAISGFYERGRKEMTNIGVKPLLASEVVEAIIGAEMDDTHRCN